MTPVAVVGCTLALVPVPPAAGGAVTIIGTPSPVAGVDGAGAYLDGLAVQVAGIVVPGGAPSPPAVVYIPSTALKTAVDGVAPLRLGDSVQGNTTSTVPGTPPTPVLVIFTVAITDAGQSSVTCD